MGPRRRLGLSRGPRLSGHAKRAAKGTPTAYASASTVFLPPRRRSCCTPLRATPGPGATAAVSRAAPHTGRAAPTENDSAASATTMRAIGARFIFVEMTAAPLQSSSGAAGNQGARLGSFAGQKVLKRSKPEELPRSFVLPQLLPLYFDGAECPKVVRSDEDKRRSAGCRSHGAGARGPTERKPAAVITNASAFSTCQQSPARPSCEAHWRQARTGASSKGAAACPAAPVHAARALMRPLAAGGKLLREARPDGRRAHDAVRPQHCPN